MDRVKGKVAIVTGAASGLGRAIATLLAKEGASVVATDVNEIGGKETVDLITGKGGESLFVLQDVTREEEWQKLIQMTLDRYGKLDVLVNCAGVFLAASIEETTLEKWRWLMSINMDGVFLGVKYAAQAMKKNGGGSIINMSSVGGLVGTSNAAAYSASKGGVRLLTKAAAIEFSKAGYDYGIRVNSVHPGVIETPMTAPLIEDSVGREELRGREGATPGVKKCFPGCPCPVSASPGTWPTVSSIWLRMNPNI